MFGVMRMPQLRQLEWREGAGELPEIELTGFGGLRKEKPLGLPICKSLGLERIELVKKKLGNPCLQLGMMKTN